MRIVICGSMSFATTMEKVLSELEAAGHSVFAPENLDTFSFGGPSEKSAAKDELDAYNKYYKEIMNSDCILVVNEEKKGIKGYIGANALIEMAFAYVLKKKIYVLHEVSESLPWYEEISSFHSEVLDGDLTVFKK